MVRKLTNQPYVPVVLEQLSSQGETGNCQAWEIDSVASPRDSRQRSTLLLAQGDSESVPSYSPSCSKKLSVTPMVVTYSVTVSTQHITLIDLSNNILA